MNRHIYCAPLRLTALARALCLATMLGSTLLPAAVQAQPQAASVRQYAIPPAPLATALTQFAAAAGVTLSFQSEWVKGRASAGLNGAYSVPAALARLLDGSGQEAVQTGPQSYRLRPVPAPRTGGPGEAAQLAPVLVTAQGLGSITEDSGSYAFGPASVGSGLMLDARQTPQSVTTVTRQRMDDMGISDLEQALAQTAGISSMTYSESTTFTVRGFGVSNLQVDGMPMNHYSSSGTAISNPLLDTVVYDRIEVVRGATGLLTGTGDPSATINLVRKRPTREFAAQAAVSAGSWGLRRAEADLSVPLTQDGAIRARLVAAHQRRDSHLDFYRQRRTVFSGTLEADLGPSTLLAIGMDWQQDRPRGSPFNGVPAFYADGTPFDAPRSMNMSARWSRWDKTYTQWFARLEHEFSPDWRAQASYSRLFTRSDMKYAASTGPYGNSRNLQRDGSGLVFGTYQVRGEQTQHNLDLRVNGRFDLLGRRHDLVMGVNGWERTADTFPMDSPRTTWALADIWAWDGELPEYQVGRRGDHTSAHTRQHGLYANARFSLSDSVHLLVGGRFSRWRTYQDNYGLDGRFTTRSAAYDTSTVFTPYVGLTWDFAPGWTAYASYTDLFKPQSAKDKDDQFLKPIVGSNLEAGVKYEAPGGRWLASLAAFETRQDNVAERDTSVPEEWRLPDGSVPYVAKGKGTQTRGVEFEISGEIAPGWQLYAGYTFNRSRDPDGNPFNTHVPRHLARLFATYRLSGAWHGVTLGGGVNWQSGIHSETTAGGKPAVLRQGSYALVSLMANWQVNPNWQVGLQVNNALDRRYRAIFSGRGANYANFGDARSVALTARYRY